MSKRGKYFPDKDSGKNWTDFGLFCLRCGKRFHGGIDRAMKPLLQHFVEEHQGENVEYGAFATPTSYEAGKKARGMGTIKEVVQLNRIWREHGSGWYFYALHYGVNEALVRIREVEEMEGTDIKRLRDQVEERKVERAGWVQD